MSNFLNLEYDIHTEQKIDRKLYSIDGKLIYNDKIEIAGKQTYRIDMPKYSSGIYILEQTTGTETKTTKIPHLK